MIDCPTNTNHLISFFLSTKDQIVMVNGISMENVHSNHTIHILKTCGKTANVVSWIESLHDLSPLTSPKSELLYDLLTTSLSFQTVKRPRTIQIPATTRPTRAASHSNLLDQDPPRRPRRYSDGSDHRDTNRYRPQPRSNSPDRNGYGNTLPLMSSGYKRLPHQDVPEKPIKTTLVKKRLTDGETGGRFHKVFLFSGEGDVFI